MAHSHAGSRVIGQIAERNHDAMTSNGVLNILPVIKTVTVVMPFWCSGHGFRDL